MTRKERIRIGGVNSEQVVEDHANINYLSATEDSIGSEGSETVGESTSPKEQLRMVNELSGLCPKVAHIGGLVCILHVYSVPASVFCSG